VSSPSRWAQGVSGRCPRLRTGACRTKDRCLGCKGEKPWHLSPVAGRANGRTAEENPTADDDATRRRERVWRMETVEEAGNHEAPKTSFLHQVDFFKGAPGNRSRL